VSHLDANAFVSEYLAKNQPVIITDAMSRWKALSSWNPTNLARELGNERVQIYGDLFKLIAIDSLSNYLEKYFNCDANPHKGVAGASVPYVRWYCHLASDERVPWADGAFSRLSADWSRPSFFPPNSFALPVCGPNETIDPSRDWFPARGLFISARGARTRLHADPLCSDAVLCQIYGKKDFVMYDPSQATHLQCGGRTVDIECPDEQVFPAFRQAHAAVSDTLEPGECLLVPAGWFHHFKSVTDSISLTWNFVHTSRSKQYLAYLGRGPQQSEKQQLAYACFESPGCRPLRDSALITGLLDAGICAKNDFC